MKNALIWQKTRKQDKLFSKNNLQNIDLNGHVLEKVAQQSSLPNYLPTSQKALSVVLLGLDMIGLYVFWLVSQALFKPKFWPSWQIPVNYLWPFILLLVFFYIFELYKLNVQISGLRSAPRTFVAVLVSCVLIVFFNAINPFAKPIPLKIVAVNFGFFSLWASFCRAFVAKVSGSRFEKVRWLVIDPENIFPEIYPQFAKKHSNQNFCVLTDAPEWVENDFLQKIGSLDTLEFAAIQSWSGVIVTNPKTLSKKQTMLLMQMRLGGLHVYNLAEFYERYLHKLPVTHLEKNGFIGERDFELLQNPIGLKLKRIMDILISGLLLIVLSPLFLLLSLLVKLTSKGPAIFKQERVGEHDQSFVLYKFRTMVIGSEKGNPYTTENDKRITAVGKVLRKMRLDELPQILNVFKGDMSLIGPRAEWINLVKTYQDQIPLYQLRHLIKPGITGWAQVLYPYGASIEDAKEKLEYDLYYIKNYSLLLDISIVFKTLRVVLLGRGR